jgi:hypothetical protein
MMLQAAIFVVSSAYCASPCCGPAGCQHTAAAVSPVAGRADSTNFHVACYAAGYAGYSAPSIANCCESWRTHLQTKWLGGASGDGWSPKCQIVVHASRQTYRAAIGRGGEQTFGSSMIDFAAGRISRRRIDLLIDTQGTVSALGHELTHVVIADAFPSTPPPAWAGEGAAVLADSVAKQQFHRRDLDLSLARQNAFHCAELLAMTNYPPPHRIAAFYGHSASLAALLADLGGSEKFVPFLKHARDSGYDAALRECYGIHSQAELHHRWQERLSAPPAAASAPAAGRVHRS